MRKRLVVVGSIVLIVVLVLVVAFLNLEGIVNRNKDFLLSKAESAIGRQVTIDNIGLSLHGGIGVRLDEFSIADDPEFSSEPFLTAKSLQVNAKILPLFKKEFEIKSVILREPLIRVIRNEEGILNTSSFGAQAAASAPDETAGGAAPLVVSLVNIENGELHFTDHSQGVDLRLTRISSKVTELDPEKPISIVMSAAFLADEPNVDVRGTFGPAGRDMNIETMPFDASFELEAIDIAALTTAVPAIGEAMPPNIAIGGTIGLQADAKGTMPSIDLNARIDATHASISAPDMFSKSPGIPLAIAAEAKVTPESITLTDIDLGFHKLSAKGKGKVELGTPPSMSLSFDTQPTSLAEWADLVPALVPYQLTGRASLSAQVSGAVSPGMVPDVHGTIELSDVGASVPQLIKPLTQARSKIDFTGSTARVDDTSLMLGSSRIHGTAQVESFEPLTVSYRASSPSLALDDVRPPNPKAKKPEVLENIRVTGRMRVEDTPTNRGQFESSGGSIGNIDYSSLSGKYDIVGQQTQIDDMVVEALDGRITGSGVIVIEDDVPAFDFHTEAQDVNVVALLDRLPDVSRQFLSGKANLNLNFKGSGKEWQDIQKTISGDGLAKVVDGAIIDFNIFDGVVDQLAGFTGNSNIISQGLKDKYPNVFKDQNTQFKDLTSDFVITNGRLLARNLALNAGQYDITGTGSIGFDKSLNLGVNLKLSRALSIDLINDFREAKYLTNDSGEIEVPFGLEGTLPKATVKFDQNYINSVFQKALLQRGLDLLKDR